MHKLKKLSSSLACKALDDLISLRLTINAKDEWVERACMMRIWITTTTSEIGDPGAAMKEILDIIFANRAKPFSAAAAHAAQTVSILILRRTSSVLTIFQALVEIYRVFI